MARRKNIRYSTVVVQEGFGGTGAINDTLAADDTSMGVDTLVLKEGRTIVPVGARFTTDGIPTVRTVSDTDNSQSWNLTNGGASAGTFTLTYNGDVTAGIDFDATVVAVQAAIDLLAGVIAGNTLTVTGTDAGPWDFKVGGTGAGLTTNTLTYDGSGLTGGPGVLTVTNDGTVTMAVTFFPAISATEIPLDDDVITWLPRRVVAEIGEGDNIEHTKNKEPQVTLARGRIDGGEAGNEVPLGVTFSFIYDWLRSSASDPKFSVTVDEALERQGNASDWISTAQDECESGYQLDIILIDTPPCTTQDAEVVFYRRFMTETNNGSVEAQSVNVTGICVSTIPDPVRVANDPDTINALV